MRALLLLVVCACGRVGFGASSPDGALGDGASDGPTDGAGGDAPYVCSPAFDICDTFEDGIDASLWAVDADITIDGTRAHRGSQSVHVQMPAFAANTGRYRTLSETQTTMTSTTFWVRAWFWLSALPAPGNGLELITAERPGDAGDYAFIFDDSVHIYSQYDLSSRQTPMLPPIGSWFCYVWKVVRAPTATGSIELTGDTPTLTLTNVVTDSASAPMTVVNLGIGFASSNTPSAQPTIDLWIDDVIVHSSSVTCSD